MAIYIRGKSLCPLCDSVIENNDAVVATSHFIVDEVHLLWRYSDAAMHQRCFLAWEHRALFVETFNQAFGATTAGNGTYLQMWDSGEILRLGRLEQDA